MDTLVSEHLGAWSLRPQRNLDFALAPPSENSPALCPQEGYLADREFVQRFLMKFWVIWSPSLLTASCPTSLLV